MIIGIDLGTTNSVAAYLTPDGPRLIPNALGDVLTPSVVGVDPSGEVLVGRTAKELQVRHPDRCAAIFKRYMGSDWKTTLASREFTPELLSSLVLRTLKQDAEHHLGEPIEAAVITVPAYFNELQRKATLNAGRIAGLKVERILNEPTAAALAYGFHSAKDEKVMLVVDLGGGTFDVSIVDLFEGSLEVRASSGEAFLGGEDFTRTLAARVLESQGLVFERVELSAPLQVARMMQLCEAAKCQLSRQSSTVIRLADKKGELPDGVPEVTVSAEQFHKWTDHIMARTELPIRRAMGDARLKAADLDEVILVGGATRMPQFVDRIRQLCGRDPHYTINPDEVVALGAAVQAGLIGRDASVEDMVVTDVSPFTLGMETSKRFGTEHREGYFLPIIHRNTTIPVSRVQRVQTVYPNQTRIEVKVYQGESRRVESNLPLGEFTVDGIPRGPAGSEVDVSLYLRLERRAGGRGHDRQHQASHHALDHAPCAAAQRSRNRRGPSRHATAQGPCPRGRRQPIRPAPRRTAIRGIACRGTVILGATARRLRISDGAGRKGRHRAASRGAGGISGSLRQRRLGRRIVTLNDYAPFRRCTRSIYG